MADHVNKATRSRIMSSVQSNNTDIEVLVRKGLFARGYRYRINDKRLPGKPDLVLPKYEATIFVNGCFWHCHHCPRFGTPKTNEDFWNSKFIANQKRDKKNQAILKNLGWRILIVWECALKGKYKKGLNTIIDEIEQWLKSDSHCGEIKGNY